ncbi:MAG: hypothetical protein OJF48_004079 [Afipia sp.]|nr:MAG: hypothetical protein OJF48_004079 [Afipia sp.]
MGSSMRTGLDATAFIRVPGIEADMAATGREQQAAHAPRNSFRAAASVT